MTARVGVRGKSRAGGATRAVELSNPRRRTRKALDGGASGERSVQARLATRVPICARLRPGGHFLLRSSACSSGK